MRVRSVGSGDAFGSGGRWQTCIHLSGEGQVLLVDCGATSLVALKAQGLDPGAVDAVAVTHLHGDHFGGLPFLILDGQFSRRSAPLQVAGPPGIRTRLADPFNTQSAASHIYALQSRAENARTCRWEDRRARCGRSPAGCAGLESGCGR